MANQLKDISQIIFENMAETKKEFSEDIIKKLGSNETLIVYCKLCEMLNWFALAERKESKSTKLILTVAEIIKWVAEEEYVDGVEKFEDVNVKKLERYYWKAYEAEQSTSAFLSENAKLFNVNILNSEKDKERVQFKYKTKEIDYYESVNHLLVNDYLLSKGIAAQKYVEKYSKHGTPTDRLRTHAIINTEFELPDEYKIYNFTIGQIKEFWNEIYLQSMKVKSENQKTFKRLFQSHKPTVWKDVNDFNLIKLNYEGWNLQSMNIDQIQELLEILSYSGKKKLKTIHSSMVSEPIIKFPNGDYYIIPSVLWYHEAERYTLQILDKFVAHYQNKGMTVATDDAKREMMFVQRLNDVFSYSKFKNDGVKIKDTDIDYIVYDQLSDTVICFETKWIIEPFTPSEIASKDKPLKKALEVQLPKYKEGLESNTEEILKKAFGKEFNHRPKHFYYFVLTNLTIGSGNLDRSNFKVINYRMLKKAVHDTKGNLLAVSQRLNAGITYLPKIKGNIDYKKTKTNCFGVEIIQPEFKVNNEFSLEIKEQS